MTTPEFSRLFAVRPGREFESEPFAIEANEMERAALARRFDLLSIESLKAEGEFQVFDRGRRARLTGRLTADVTQSCVVTLEPVQNRIEESFERLYEQGAEENLAQEMDLDPEAEDPPDPLPEDGVDAGEAVAEQLGLAFDPYPRAPGAGDPAEELGSKVETNGDVASGKPFAVLERLKKR